MNKQVPDLSKYKCRGLVKWQGFFMTEHNKELRDFYSEQNNEDWIGDLNGDYLSASYQRYYCTNWCRK